MKFRILFGVLVVGLLAFSSPSWSAPGDLGKLKEAWGDFGYSTRGGLGSLGRNGENFTASAVVQIPASGGYSHAGVLLGHRVANPAQPDLSPAFLAVLHGGNGEYFVSLFDGLTNGRELQRVPVRANRGGIELNANAGIITVRFNGERLIEHRANRAVRGEWGIRGGTATPDPVSISEVRGS